MSHCPGFPCFDSPGRRRATPGSMGPRFRLAAAIGTWVMPIFLAMVSAPSALAQEPSDAVLRVATRIVPPLVVEQNGTLAGFSIDLWTSIAERLKVKTTYRID